MVLPEGVDDPRRPSGGNTYDRRICRELAATGWAVDVHVIPGAWPRAGGPAHAALATVFDRIADGDVVVVDGLVASAAADVLVPRAARLRFVVLLHMPLGGDSEAAVVSCAASVVVTSAWTEGLVHRTYGARNGRVRVAEPGVDAAQVAPGTATGGELLCVGAVIPGKGHDLLVDALERIAHLHWHCVCVGTLERDPGYGEQLRHRVDEAGLEGRIRFTGVRTDSELERLYGEADVLVLPSRAETYGMVLTEALARGLPVIASDVGGVPEAVGHVSGGARPGILVRADDADAVREALTAWLGDAGLRADLRRAALERRGALRPWTATAGDIALACEAAAV
jgi:glycosyltransferase involved in cell wall biosynthesis